jgi:hypothetical protein
LSSLVLGYPAYKPPARSKARVSQQYCLKHVLASVGRLGAFPHKDGVGIADLGAEWLNDTTQPQVYQLARKLGLDFSEVKVQGEAALQDLNKALIRHPYGEQAPVSYDPLGHEGRSRS